MAKQNLKFTRVRTVKPPHRGTDKSAGIDFFVPSEIERIDLQPGQAALIPSGIHVKVPMGYALIAFNKSGVATKQGLQVGACVVDEDYEGELHIHVINVSDSETIIVGGQKLVQFVLLPVYYAEVEETESVKDLYAGSNSARGTGGFGSTGS